MVSVRSKTKLEVGVEDGERETSGRKSEDPEEIQEG